MKINLLEETETALRWCGYDTSDVDFVYYDEDLPSTSWQTFAAAAADAYFDPGYGVREVLPTLKVVMRDGCRFEREEYDGSEWWRLVRPRVPKNEEAGGVPCELVGRW